MKGVELYSHIGQLLVLVMVLRKTYQAVHLEFCAYISYRGDSIGTYMYMCRSIWLQYACVVTLKPGK